MKKYEAVSVTVERLEVADIVRTSGYNSQIPGTTLPDQDFD